MFFSIFLVVFFKLHYFRCVLRRLLFFQDKKFFITYLRGVHLFVVKERVCVILFVVMKRMLMWNKWVNQKWSVAFGCFVIWRNFHKNSWTCVNFKFKIESSLKPKFQTKHIKYTKFNPDSQFDSISIFLSRKLAISFSLFRLFCLVFFTNLN